MEQEAQFKLVNSMPKDVLEILDIEAQDILKDLLNDELWGKYLNITREHQLESEGLSLWVESEDENKYMVQVEFKDFDEALYIPATKDQLNFKEEE